MRRWQIKLQCDHWSVEMPREEAAAAARSGIASCGATKHGGQQPIGAVCRSGSTSPQPIDVLLNPGPDTRVIVREDGLAIRHFSTNPNTKNWWCRYCDGKRPGKPLLGIARGGLDEVFREWDIHLKSPHHIRELAVKAAVRDFDAALDRSR